MVSQQQDKCPVLIWWLWRRSLCQSGRPSCSEDSTPPQSECRSEISRGCRSHDAAPEDRRGQGSSRRQPTLTVVEQQVKRWRSQREDASVFSSFSLFCLPTYQSRFFVCGAPTRDSTAPTLPAMWDSQTPEDPQRTPKAGLTGAVRRPAKPVVQSTHQHECSEWTAVRVDRDRGDGTPTQRRFVLQDWVESDDSPPTVSLHVPARQDGRTQRDTTGASRSDAQASISRQPPAFWSLTYQGSPQSEGR